jgi:putative ABC transport system permease protein
VQREIVTRLRAIPGVEAASGVYLRPLWSHVGNDVGYVLEGQRLEDATDNPIANQEAALPGYFDTMGIRLVTGRDFTEHDNAAGALVVIVSESLARWAWPNQDPVGRRLRFGGGALKDSWLTVVGVAADTRYREVEKARFDIYQPYGQFNGLLRHFVVRSSNDPRTIAGDIRRVVREIDSSQPIELTTMDEIVATAMGRWRLNARLFGALAALALLLAGVGTYSVMNYAVSRRTQEIGLRIALGAGRSQISGLVLKDGLRLAGLGIAIGVVIAYAVSGLLRHLLIGVGPREPFVFVGAAALLCGVAVIACYLPARRAATVDPMIAMRSE